MCCIAGVSPIVITTRNLNCCSSFFAAGAKTSAIGLVFCGVLQWRDIKPSQYISISGINLVIAVLQNLATINISFCANTIVAI